MSGPTRLGQDPRQIAAEFASKWYARPGHGCTEATLAAMLKDLLEDTIREARKLERDCMTRRVVALMTGEEP